MRILDRMKSFFSVWSKKNEPTEEPVEEVTTSEKIYVFKIRPDSPFSEGPYRIKSVNPIVNQEANRIVGLGFTMVPVEEGSGLSSVVVSFEEFMQYFSTEPSKEKA